MVFTSRLGHVTGGQQPRAARAIASHLDRIAKEVYVEPFLGHGMVYRSLRDHAPVEVLNDKNCSQTTYVRKMLCSTKDPTKCGTLKKARVTCRRDWKTTLKRNDGGGTLFYLDPPYETATINMYRDQSVKLDDIVKEARALKGAVAISYKDKPEFARKLCRAPFKCHRITKNLNANFFTEILAIKPSRARQQGERTQPVIDTIRLEID